MLTNSLILSLSSSIDSLGIGITYGIKNTKISYWGKIVLFTISFSISLVSVWFGDMIKNIFSDFVAKLIGNSILIGMGVLICFQSIHKRGLSSTSFDLDASNSIDSKEALILGIALSLDCFCIGVGGSILGISSFLFPLFISIFQLIFLSFGNIIGKRLHNLGNLPDNIWSSISGFSLVLIGLVRLICF